LKIRSFILSAPLSHPATGGDIGFHGDNAELGWRMAFPRPLHLTKYGFSIGKWMGFFRVLALWK
jgi:hypothetical protein